LSRFVKPRAARSADIVASVPEETSRSFSIDGIMNCTISPNSISRCVGAPKLVPDAAVWTIAATTSGSAWPRISGPHEPTKSV
jgi:hypothetical protein